MEPPPVVPYFQDHHSHTGTSTNHFNQPHESPAQPHAEPDYKPTYIDPRYQPDSRYQSEPRYPELTDPRFPSYTDRLNSPDNRYYVVDTRYPITTPRRPPPRQPQSPVHYHTSGPVVRQTTWYISKSSYSHCKNTFLLLGMFPHSST